MSRKRHACWMALMLAAVAIAPAGAHGAMTYLSQERRIVVDAAVNGSLDGQFRNAPNFGPFNSLITHNFREGRGTAIVSQNSSLLSDSILMDGAADLRVVDFGVFAAVSSRLNIFFRLTSDSPVHVIHAHSRSGDTRGQSRARAVLTGPTGVVFEWLEDRDNPSTWPQSPFGGLLGVGDYNLQVEVLVIRDEISSLGVSGAAVAWAMTIPAPSAPVGLATLALFAQRRRSHRPA